MLLLCLQCFENCYGERILRRYERQCTWVVEDSKAKLISPKCNSGVMKSEPIWIQSANEICLSLTEDQCYYKHHFTRKDQNYYKRHLTMIGFLHKVTRHEAIVLSFAAIHVIWEANEIKRRPPE